MGGGRATYTYPRYGSGVDGVGQMHSRLLVAHYAYQIHTNTSINFICLLYFKPRKRDKKEVERARCTCMMSSCCQREIDAANSPPAFATPAPPRSCSVAPLTPKCLPPTRPSRSDRCSSAARERHTVGSLEPARTRTVFAHRDTQTNKHTTLRNATHFLRLGMANCPPTARDVVCSLVIQG